MRPGWKRLAERAANIAFDDREIGDALAGALQGDRDDEVPENFVGHVRDALDDHQGDLFGTSVTEKLEALRGEAAGRPLAGAHRPAGVVTSHSVFPFMIPTIGGPRWFPRRCTMRCRS